MFPLFKQAGSKNISRTEANGKLKCGAVETYGQEMTDGTPPSVATLRQADEAIKEKIKRFFVLVN